MHAFQGKVAVVTGAASGIGRALAVKCANEGLNVVLADIEEPALREAEAALKAGGAHVIGVVTDVSKAEQMERLCQATMDEFGAVHLLFNNAGVAAGLSLWGSHLQDWEWTVNVNLWGVIHGIRTFVPVMLKQGDACHVVNTASVAGLINGAFGGIYAMTKHAVVSLSETLHNEMTYLQRPIGVSVLCPGFVNTRIMDSARNRPEHLRYEPSPLTAEQREGVQWMRRQIEKGLPPDILAEQTFAAIREKKFYIVTHPEYRDAIRQRAQDIMDEHNPRLPANWGKRD